MISITLKGRMLSTNHIYGQTKFGRYLKPNARALKESYIEQTQSQYNKDPLSYPIMVVARLYWYGKEPDIDNVHKLSLDALNGLVREDDSQIKRFEIIKMRKDNKNPRIEIKVATLSPLRS